jgi:hypothetical protein
LKDTKSNRKTIVLRFFIKLAQAMVLLSASSAESTQTEVRNCGLRQNVVCNYIQMRKQTSILLIIGVCVILYSIFGYRQSEYIAGEYRYFTIYEKYKATEKEFSFIPSAYDEDKYNLGRLKDIAKIEIDKLEDFRLKLNEVYHLMENPNNTIADYESYVEVLNSLEKEIEDNRQNFDWQKNDLRDLSKFIHMVEKNLYSIKLYEAEISHLYSVTNSMDSIATTYKQSATYLALSASYSGLDIAKKAEAEKEREKEYQIANDKAKIEQIAHSNYYNSSQSTYSTDLNLTYYSSLLQSASQIQSPLPQYYSTNTNPEHVQVDGYYKSNGTYVESYIRTAPNTTIRDNFSTAPNLNPYTGKIGKIKFK